MSTFCESRSCARMSTFYSSILAALTFEVGLDLGLRRQVAITRAFALG